jgi:hypothetical protein
MATELRLIAHGRRETLKGRVRAWYEMTPHWAYPSRCAKALNVDTALVTQLCRELMSMGALVELPTPKDEP